MPSYFASWNAPPEGLRSAGPIKTGAGSGFAVLRTERAETEEISVCERLAGSVDDGYSCTVPLTHTRLRTAAFAEGVLLVNINSPSEVAGSPSPAGIWMKNPFDRRAVTTPLVLTTVPAS